MCQKVNLETVFKHMYFLYLLRQSFVGPDVNVNSDFRPECSWVKVIVELPDLSSRPERLSLPERLVFHSLQENRNSFCLYQLQLRKPTTST